MENNKSNKNNKQIQDKYDNMLFELHEQLQKWYCSTFAHNWTFDQCGWWQHQYCVRCHDAKYPEFEDESCSGLSEQMGDITESQYCFNNAKTEKKEG